MQRFKASLTLFLFLFVTIATQAIPYRFSEKIDWGDVQKYTTEEGLEISRLTFDGAYYPYLDVLPTFIKDYRIHTGNAYIPEMPT